MPSPEEFDETLEELADLVLDLGHEIEERSVPNIVDITIRGEEYSLTGHRCAHNDSRYLVAGHQDLRPVTIAYILSITRNLALEMEVDVANSMVEGQFEEEDDLLSAATENLMDQVARNEMATFESYCYQFISDDTHETALFKNDLETVTGFVVSNDIFPYEDSFGISDLYQAVRSVVSSGERGSKLVRRSVFLDIDEESPEESEIEINLGW